MTDIASRLDAVKRDIERLAALAAPAEAEEAHGMVSALQAELDDLMREASALPSEHTLSDLPHAPRHEELRCPICSLRSFIYRRGTLRRSNETDSGFEALFHCRSCGHEAWHETR
ncbi:MAG: hypothetical protein JJU25_14610 [Halomonas sp.]|nr:hypothetical protein [Halomonas sp.]MCC5883850.1 hypothetical protein [Halomonas sp.]